MEILSLSFCRKAQNEFVASFSSPIAASAAPFIYTFLPDRFVSCPVACAGHFAPRSDTSDVFAGSFRDLISCWRFYPQLPFTPALRCLLVISFLPADFPFNIAPFPLLPSFSVNFFFISVLSTLRSVPSDHSVLSIPSIPSVPSVPSVLSVLSGLLCRHCCPYSRAAVSATVFAIITAAIVFLLPAFPVRLRIFGRHLYSHTVVISTTRTGIKRGVSPSGETPLFDRVETIRIPKTSMRRTRS